MWFFFAMENVWFLFFCFLWRLCEIFVHICMWCAQILFFFFMSMGPYQKKKKKKKRRVGNADWWRSGCERLILAMQNEKIVARVLFDLSISTPIVSYPLFLAMTAGECRSIDFSPALIFTPSTKELRIFTLCWGILTEKCSLSSVLNLLQL